MQGVRKLFPGDTDRRVAAILKPAFENFESAAVVAKSHRDLLRQNGVTLKIFIGTGGDHRKRVRK